MDKIKVFLAGLASKKFTYASVALVSFIVLLAVKLINAENFVSLMYILIPSYLGADTAQSILKKKEVVKEKEIGSGSGGQPEDSIGKEV